MAHEKEFKIGTKIWFWDEKSDYKMGTIVEIKSVNSQFMTLKVQYDGKYYDVKQKSPIKL